MNKKQLLLITLIISSQTTLSISKAAISGAFVAGVSIATIYGNQAKQATLNATKEAKDLYIKFKNSLNSKPELDAVQAKIDALEKKIATQKEINKIFLDIHPNIPTKEDDSTENNLANLTNTETDHKKEA